jgi:hypothetical protein
VANGFIGGMTQKMRSIPDLAEQKANNCATAVRKPFMQFLSDIFLPLRDSSAVSGDL